MSFGQSVKNWGLSRLSIASEIVWPCFCFVFCFLLLCYCVTRSCQVNHFLIGLQIIRFTLNRLDVIIVNGMMYQVNQRCRFLSWTGTMNRCYWCILGLHAHAIYSDVISFCTERVLFGNTVDHFRRSWIYYSSSTETIILHTCKMLTVTRLIKQPEAMHGAFEKKTKIILAIWYRLSVSWFTMRFLWDYRITWSLRSIVPLKSNIICKYFFKLTAY